MKQNLALVNCALDELSFRKGENTLTLSYLSEALRENYEIKLLPLVQYHRNDFSKMADEIKKECKNKGLIGISTNTYSKPYADKMLQILKEEYHDKKIFLGGQGIKEINPAIVIPKETVAPIAAVIDAVNDMCDAEVLLTNICPQNCGYCNTPKNQIQVPVEDYVDRLIYLKKDRKIRHLTLYDNNPLHMLNFKRTSEFFSLLEEKTGYIPDSVFYCDPALLTDKKEFKRITEFMKRFKGMNSNMFFGRERPDERISIKIKRRVNGMQRSQEHLDNEKKAILKIASMLSEPGKNGLNFTLVLNYILTPFENSDSISCLIEEAMMFSRYRRIIIKSNFLWVFPFTETAIDYKGNYVDSDELGLNLEFFNFDSLNLWKKGFENSRFLDLCNALNCRLYFHKPNEYYSWYNLSMLRLAGDLSLGLYQKEKTSEYLIGNLPAELKKNLGNRIREFTGFIEGNYLPVDSDETLCIMMKKANMLFFNIPEEMAARMSEEYRRILEARERHS